MRSTHPCLPTLAIVEEHPVVNAIFRLAAVLEDLGEEFAQEVVVGCLLETELADIVEVDSELLCEKEEPNVREGQLGLVRLEKEEGQITHQGILPPTP